MAFRGSIDLSITNCQAENVYVALQQGQIKHEIELITVYLLQQTVICIMACKEAHINLQMQDYESIHNLCHKDVTHLAVSTTAHIQFRPH